MRRSGRLHIGHQFVKREPGRRSATAAQEILLSSHEAGYFIHAPAGSETTGFGADFGA